MCFSDDKALSSKEILSIVLSSKKLLYFFVYRMFGINIKSN